VYTSSSFHASFNASVSRARGGVDERELELDDDDAEANDDVGSFFAVTAPLDDAPDGDELIYKCARVSSRECGYFGLKGSG
jgi:hypothetical protein